MDPAITAALIYGGTALASGTGTAVANGKLNRKNREWQEYMYRQQRDHGKEDTEYYFNKYQSPEAQMQHYRDAGLNPHLIYGQQITARQADTADIPGVSGQNPYDLSFVGDSVKGGLQSYYDVKQNEASLSKMSQDLKNQIQSEQLTIAKLIETYANIDTKNLANEYTRKSLDTSLQFLTLRNDKLVKDMETIDREQERKDFIMNFSQEMSRNADKRANQELNLRKLHTMSMLNLNEAQIRKIDAEIERIMTDDAQKKATLEEFERSAETTHWFSNKLQKWLGMSQEDADVLSRTLGGLAGYSTKPKKQVHQKHLKK